MECFKRRTALPLLLAACGLANVALAQSLPSQPPSAAAGVPPCVSPATIGRNPNCKSGNSAAITNGCTQTIDARICIMTTRGKWDCGVKFGIQPQQSFSYPACFGVDQVFVSARASDANQPLAKPPGPSF